MKTYLIQNPIINLIFACLVLISGCSNEELNTPQSTLQGSGSTFAEIIVQKWATEYERRNEAIEVVYEGIGSGGGEKEFLAGKTDFGATDAGVTQDVIDSVDGGAIQVPITAGVIVLAYNPEGLPKNLQLPREVYADVFLGKEVRWNDAHIQKANPDQDLPNEVIQPVVRLDSSGTTWAFTNHLSSISDEWREEHGNPKATGDTDLGVKTLNWSGQNLKGDGNSGVAGLVQRTPYTIGYVQYGAARDVNLPMASLENQAGSFVAPGGTSGLETLLNAKLPSNLVGYFPDPEGEHSYPIVTFTWMLLRQKYADSEKAQQVKDFVQWCLTSGQDYSEASGNVRLAPHVIRSAEDQLGKIGS
ncbi:phosphate ABC transporter substrate-binding protein PstS [Rhodopirellula sallentina]|uniref:Phosphate-binding protein n=1 Tax=Rhodopirellula sallentina SM41 TaxID=1263870 RepID=M5U5E4_9BACT|nr:phosphate ABC transporter substrate-binding protein PstS [Rhodopirellula sallentina]EMI53081.1 Periplasmic phosphate binding protein [Rhodopirellula sallentina SM41]